MHPPLDMKIQIETINHAAGSQRRWKDSSN